MSTPVVMQDCPFCNRPYTSDRKKTINLTTDTFLCSECSKDFNEAQNNYRKWGISIGRLLND